MLISAILKAIFFYFIFKTIRGLLRTYSNYNKVKAQMNNSMYEHMKSDDFSKSNKKTTPTDVIEADFKVLD